ncbi:dienelactone hydrolase family protein [Leptospira levettii]|uniref:Dienelactone hydrolase family protein n=1 Tax=Leptospira levettii TaxID=2023178 RepID=A0A5F2AFA0_9LEPT|nr:dienelactone hydrolase family protein [Leptospira levettii]PKA27109.1 dienelactone hydrolase [Leptospira sp. mixed culture ATI2-C-A1]MCG6146908.1 dienelactone hydrolase family protein [Leptospira levettii]MCW7465798.1 dienelactone hydrolase family protein [Leptospira levettii]MCW7510536.1 dienelactone hydrolase family protein [Leptospira levettii]MCW7514289.1 dienelactone hydrolase family protein [Leptospira levettii]
MKLFLSIIAMMMAFQCSSLPTSELPVKSTVTLSPLEYKLDGKTYEGFMAVDSTTTGKRPGILVIHEWWGVNEYPKQRAKQLADLGYVAFVMDVYGKGIVAKDHVEAGKLSSANGDPKILLKKIYKAIEILKSNPNVDPTKIGAIGYCFGGGGVIELALDGADLKGGVVSFHGMLGSKNLATGVKKIKTKVLVHHGADDPFIPKNVVETFVKTITEAKAPVTFVSHPGAVHGFTRPGAEKHGLPGLAYNEKADYASFESMKDFFAKNFK